MKKNPFRGIAVPNKQSQFVTGKRDLSRAHVNRGRVPDDKMIRAGFASSHIGGLYLD